MFITLLIALLGCSKGGSGQGEPEPEPKPEPKPIPIHLNLQIQALSKATETGFESGDKTGLYVVNHHGTASGELSNTGNHADNMCFTYTTAWTPAQQIYWLDETTKADFYCYFPYSAAVKDVRNHPFAVKADQSTATDYKACDFLWGKTGNIAPTEKDVPITVNHLFSSIEIRLEAGDGFTAESLAAAQVAIHINRLRTQAAIDLATGTATAKGDEQTIVPWKDGEVYRALIVPQSVTDGDLIVVNVDGKDYVLNKAFTFVANKRHIFTVKVNKTSNGINVGIGQWEEDETDNGGVAE